MRWLRLSLLALGACAAESVDVEVDPNEGLLRDFLDGKFDGAGHPLNAKILPVQECERGCEVAIPDGAQTGDLVINVRVRVLAKPGSGSIVKARVLDASGAELAKESLTVSRMRNRRIRASTSR